MKKFLLAVVLCIMGVSAQAANENVICLVNGKTTIYEDVLLQIDRPNGDVWAGAEDWALLRSSARW